MFIFEEIVDQEIQFGLLVCYREYKHPGKPRLDTRKMFKKKDARRESRQQADRGVSKSLVQRVQWYWRLQL